NGQSTAFGARAEIDPKLWSQQKQKAIGRTDDAVSVNSKVESYKSRLLRMYNDHVNAGAVVTAVDLVDKFLGKTPYICRVRS
ncbi:MAG: hypothetical protein LUD68_09370, partial [Rikenellaceae bacterium]|nr:hypothetical protein [Rikenellaceae bacterium]